MHADQPNSPHSSTPQFGSPTFASQPSPASSSNRHSESKSQAHAAQRQLGQFASRKYLVCWGPAGPRKGTTSNNASPCSKLSYTGEPLHHNCAASCMPLHLCVTLPRAVLKSRFHRTLSDASLCCFFADQAAHSQDTTRTHESFAAQSSWPHPFGSFEEQDIQRQPSGSNRQALTDATNGSALGDARDWQPPRQELGRFVPPGLVSYQT